MITVVGRKLIIPETDKQIGTTYDNNSEVRHLRINRITTGGVDLSNLRFKLDLEYADTTLDTCLLDAEVQDEYILLTWTIPDSCVAHKGTVWAAVRAYDENGTVKWATNRGPLYVDHTIFDGEAYSGKLTEFEQLEERITQKTETLDANESERQAAEEQRKENEERRVNNEAEWQEQAEAAITRADEILEAATDKAQEAASSATSAGQSATIATQKAEVATTKAAEAAASAERAQQAAGCDGTAQSISAIDTQGLLTEIGGNSNAQALLDELALRVATQLVSNTAFTAELLKYVAKSQIVNNLLATETGNVLDAVQGKALADMIGNTADLPGGAADIVSAIVTQNNNFDKYYSLSDAIQIPSGADLNNYTDFGNYVSSAASISSTLQNCPALNGGFVLHVERVTGATDGTFLKQRIIYNEAKSLEFWRVKTGKESWSSWVSPITNADYNAQSITNQYGLNLHLVKFGNDNLKVIRLSGYINKTLTAGTEYIIASNVSLKSRVDWYHNVFVSGKGSELTVYLNIDNDGNVKITPKTAIASGTAINMMEYYV